MKPAQSRLLRLFITGVLAALPLAATVLVVEDDGVGMPQGGSARALDAGPVPGGRFRVAATFPLDGTGR